MIASRLCLVCARAREKDPDAVLCAGCVIERRAGGDRRDPKTQGWWLTGVLSVERRSGQDRRKP